MNRETLKELNDEIQDIQRRTIRLGGRIHLTAIYEADNPEVEVIPDEIDKLKTRLDLLQGKLDKTVFGKYDVVFYSTDVPADPVPTWRAAYALSFKEADHQARLRNENRARAKDPTPGYFKAVSLKDIEESEEFAGLMEVV